MISATEVYEIFQQSGYGLGAVTGRSPYGVADGVFEIYSAPNGEVYVRMETHELAYVDGVPGEVASVLTASGYAVGEVVIHRAPVTDQGKKAIRMQVVLADGRRSASK